jgi:hypothetical protein
MVLLQQLLLLLMQAAPAAAAFATAIKPWLNHCRYRQTKEGTLPAEACYCSTSVCCRLHASCPQHPTCCNAEDRAALPSVLNAYSCTCKLTLCGDHSNESDVQGAQADWQVIGCVESGDNE